MCQALCMYALLFSHLLLTIPPRIIIPIIDGESEDKIRQLVQGQLNPGLLVPSITKLSKKKVPLAKRKKKRESLLQEH